MLCLFGESLHQPWFSAFRQTSLKDVPDDANADGGTIVLGINDKAAGPTAFVGTTLDAQFLQRRIYELTEPSLLVTSEKTRLRTPALPC